MYCPEVLQLVIDFRAPPIGRIVLFKAKATEIIQIC